MYYHVVLGHIRNHDGLYLRTRKNKMASLHAVLPFRMVGYCLSSLLDYQQGLLSSHVHPSWRSHLLFRNDSFRSIKRKKGNSFHLALCGLNWCDSPICRNLPLCHSSLILHLLQNNFLNVKHAIIRRKNIFLIFYLKLFLYFFMCLFYKIQ